MFLFQLLHRIFLISLIKWSLIHVWQLLLEKDLFLTFQRREKTMEGQAKGTQLKTKTKTLDLNKTWPGVMINAHSTLLLPITLSLSLRKTNHHQTSLLLIGFFCIFLCFLNIILPSWTSITTIFCYSIINISTTTRSSLLLNLLGKAVVNGIVLFSFFHFHRHPSFKFLSCNFTGSFETSQVI